MFAHQNRRILYTLLQRLSQLHMLPIPARRPSRTPGIAQTNSQIA